MKTKSKKSIVIGICLGLMLLLAGGSALHAQRGGFRGPFGFGPEGHAGMIRDHLIQQLDLDQAQKQELDAIVQDLLSKRKDFHEMRKSGREEVVEILKADTVDNARIGRLIAQHRERVGELLSAVGSRLTDFVNLLTPEQRQRLATMIESRGECPSAP